MPRDRVFKLAIAIAVLAALAYSCAERASRFALTEQRSQQEALARDSLEAAADSSRIVNAKAAAFGDSVAVVERRAIQAAQRSDALDHALGLERAARLRLQARIDGLSARVRSDTVYVSAADGVRRAAFEVRSPPYSVHADVELPAPPEPARMDVRVALDTIALDVRLACGPATGTGVRPASAVVVAPPWAAVRLGRVEQAPSVCGGSSGERAPGFRASVRRLVERVGVTVGFGLTRDASGVVRAGPGMMVGVRAWP